MLWSAFSIMRPGSSAELPGYIVFMQFPAMAGGAVITLGKPAADTVRDWGRFIGMNVVRLIVRGLARAGAEPCRPAGGMVR